MLLGFVLFCTTRKIFFKANPGDEKEKGICDNKLFFFIVTGDLNFLKLKPSSEPLITWRIVEKRVPWGIILLLGGGFALAKGCEVSGEPYCDLITLLYY